MIVSIPMTNMSYTLFTIPLDALSTVENINILLVFDGVASTAYTLL